jgi:lipopolysaccharide export system protein LptA
VSFNTNAKLTYGRNEISGQRLVYNIRTQSVGGQKPGAAGGNDRVRIVIQPDKAPQTSAPETDPGKKQ